MLKKYKLNSFRVMLSDKNKRGGEETTKRFQEVGIY